MSARRKPETVIVQRMEGNAWPSDLRINFGRFPSRDEGERFLRDVSGLPEWSGKVARVVRLRDLQVVHITKV